MANKKISLMTAAATLTGAELAHAVQGGNSRRTTVGAISAFVQSDKIDKIADTLVVEVIGGGDNIVVGDGAAYVPVPVNQAGRDLVGIEAWTIVAGTGTGSQTIDIQVARVRAGTPADILTTKLTIDEGELHSKDATTAVVIGTTNDDVAEGDYYRVDLDAVPGTTPGDGLYLAFKWQAP